MIQQNIFTSNEYNHNDMDFSFFLISDMDFFFFWSNMI